MKRVLAIAMLLCLLLTVGCSGGSIGIKTDEKPIEVKAETLKSVVTSYAAKNCEGFESLHYSTFSNVPTIGDSAFFLGRSMENNYIYRTELDGSSPAVIAQRDNDAEDWREITAFGDKLYVYENKSGSLIEFDAAGNRLWTIEMPEDTLYLPTLAGGSRYIFAFNKGQLLAIDPDSENPVAFTIGATTTATIGKRSDGRVILGTFEEKGTRISVIDEENQCLGESRYIDIMCSIEGCGSEWSVYLQADKLIYGFDFESGRLEKLFSLIDVGISTNAKLYDCGNGNFIYTQSFDDYSGAPTLIYKVEVPADAKTLTLATISGVNWDMQRFILRWNAQHPECRVEIKDYSVYNTESDLSIAQEKLSTDIGAGEIPDLYDLSIDDVTLNTPLLVRRGLLEDLYPYLDADPELDRSDFLSGPLKAMELDGGLYQATSQYRLFTTVGAAADVGSPEEWTYAGLEQKIAENDRYRRLTDGQYDRNEWLRVTVEASGERLIDWEKGECYFDSDYFIHLLELAAGMEDIDFGGTTSLSKMLEQSGGLLLTLTSATIVEGEIGAQIFGDGNYAFVGYPEIGAVVYPTCSIGMSAHSENKEECWQFVRELLKNGSSASFPLRYDEIEEDYETECKNEYVDDGQKQAMRDFIAHAESASACYRPDDALWAIIKAEVNKLYGGQNNAEQTAKAIQSKVSIYIAEQS